jgi:hypothetical protein
MGNWAANRLLGFADGGGPVTVVEDDEETASLPDAGTVDGDVAALLRGPGTANGEVAAWPRGPGTPDETIAKVVAPLKDEMVESVRPVPSGTSLPAVGSTNSL